MKNLIVVSGHLGSTLKAGRILAEKLGGADVFDTNTKRGSDFGGYENYVFGANIRMFRINPRFKRWARKLKKETAGKRVYVYLVGIDVDNAEKYLVKAHKILPAAETVFVWGELDATNAKGFAKTVIESVIAGTLKDGKQMPHLKEDELDALAEKIKADNGQHV